MTSNDLIELAEVLADHQGITHWGISHRIFGRGDVFAGLKDGRRCLNSTIERAERWFAQNWPDDLPWPEYIMRPDRHVDRERVA